MFRNKNAVQDLKEEEIPKSVREMQKDKSSKKENKSKKNSKKDRKLKNKLPLKKRIKRFILIILAIIFVAIIINTIIGAFRWKQLTVDMFTNECSKVIDTSGNVIAELGSERKKIKVKFDDIPDNLKNAYVSIEDERFYEHSGIDIKRTGGAILSYIFHAGNSSYGGSTITQQLVKNLTGDNTDSVTRKVKEWLKAYQLEWYFSKDEILEMYLNVIYVGPNIYGVGTGAEYYFSKDVSELSLAECAFLAGINNSPNSYNPFNEDVDNTEKISKRTKTVLQKMLELGYITEEEYNIASSEVDSGLDFDKGTIESSDGIYSYHTDALTTEVISDIADKYNITETFATNYIYLSGLNINSTQNSDIQDGVEVEFNKREYKVASRQGGDSSQAAMVIIDHETGQVVACSGGLGEKTTARGLNRATQSTRQTGSAIKPLAVVLPRN